MNEYIDISSFNILNHCRKRWKKRRLDFTPKNEKRVCKIEDAIKFPMKIIRYYPLRETYRVTDNRYEFVVDIKVKSIITVNACKRITNKKDIKKLKNKIIEKEYAYEKRQYKEFLKGWNDV